MKAIVIKEIEKEVPPPLGNGFDIYAFKSYTSQDGIHVDAGISLAIPNGLRLHLESVGKWIVLGWTTSGGRLNLVLSGVTSPMKGDKVAKAWVVPEDIVPVRFIQSGEKGGRIIRGDAKIADSIENRESKS